MQFSLMLQPKPNITYKSWLKVTFQGAHAVSGTPDPPFGSYFFHGLSERPLELIVLFEVRMKQTVMIENHFLSGKIISISLQCHPFPPHPSSLNTDPAPPPLMISETSPAHFIVGFSRVFFFLLTQTQVVRHDFIDRQVLAASVRSRRICRSAFDIAKKANCTYHSQSQAWAVNIIALLNF